MQSSWWIALLPPAWFAGVDDLLAGAHTFGSAILALLALLATGLVLGLAFGKLAQDYETGLQTLSEHAVTKPRPSHKRRWIDRNMVTLSPFCWWLRNPVSRASFLLIAAYLVRDRDVKLRIYPGIAPILVVPLVFLVRSRDPGGFEGGFGTTFTRCIPRPCPPPRTAHHSSNTQRSYEALRHLRRARRCSGPALICHGERCAVLIFFTLPLMILSTVVVLIIQRDPTQLLLLLPGFVAIPVFSLIPHLGGNAIPLSQPIDGSKSARRGFTVIVAMGISLAIAGIATLTWSRGWFSGGFSLIEVPISAALYLLLLGVPLRLSPTALLGVSPHVVFHDHLYRQSRF